MIFILRNPDIRDRCIAYLTALDLKVPQEVSIRPYKSKRNSAQNRLYWALLQEIGERMGKSADTLHEYAKRRWIGYDEEEIDGEIIKTGFSTTTLDTGDFADYVTKIQQWAAEEIGLVS